MPMVRVLPWVILLCLAGCSTTPAALGITGPGAPAPPAAPLPDDSLINDPGLPDRDMPYSPSMMPNTGGSTHYYGYD